ncbi:GtrA family protein [Sulfitobacter aestuariivivens]|uniref:GtrA family protein n=1 Tax=Sulfitobacter aestuariivivens TaxID=2766981 RepID=A0A927D778_9RHOB|nr:GtrA family protein [Sulfitobacter aestuariivivens]MBD3666199.1 GtrA family protein [Sulfitobacter aestuariivivens]
MFHVFLVCSGIAALVNIAVGYLLYGYGGLDSPALYAFSVATAFLAGMVVSFILNRRFTYAPSGRRAASELPDFLMVSIGGLLLTTGLSFVFFTYGGAALERLTMSILPPETSAHMSAIGLTALYSFLAHKHVSFRRGPLALWRRGARAVHALGTR